MNVIKECRECRLTTDSDQMVSPCDCRGSIAYIHIKCLKNCIETSGQQNLVELKGQQKCGFCGQNWFRKDSIKMNGIKECRECRSITDSDQMVTPCDCPSKRAHIHYQCLRNLVELKGQQKCCFCGQNWSGIQIVKKRKGFTDFLEEKSIKVEFFFALFGLMAAILSTIIFASIFEQNDKNIWIRLTKIFTYLANFLLFCVTFSLVTSTLIKFKKWKKTNFKYTVIECQVLDISLQPIAC